VHRRRGIAGQTEGRDGTLFSDQYHQSQKVRLVLLPYCNLSAGLISEGVAMLSSLRGEQYSKVVIHPTDASVRESWLDQLALACDSEESDDEYETDEKARPDDVAASAKEFDAKQVISLDGQKDTEREVSFRALTLI
jgi:hypothetical protein